MGYGIQFIRLLLRQAQKASTNSAAQKQFLENIIDNSFETSKNGERSLISTTINGKTVSFSVPPGMTRTDAMLAASVALDHLEAGVEPTDELIGRPL